MDLALCFDREIQGIIVIFTGPFSTGCLPGVSLKSILPNHILTAVDVAVEVEDRQRINVRRRHIWEDIKKALSKPTFQASVGLSVTFIGESAVDVGGPQREVLRLGIAAMRQDTRLFEGPESSRGVTHNMLSLQQGAYSLAGKFISLSIMYGGPGPHCFSPSTVEYLFKEKVRHASVEEIADYEIREKVKKVNTLRLVLN